MTDPPIDQPIDRQMVLAAVERAVLHRARTEDSVPVIAVLARLHVARRSQQARAVLELLRELSEQGALELGRRHGLMSWSLTARGRRRLHSARSAGRAPQLPESPQHRAWRNGRSLATHEIGRLRAALAAAAAEVPALLEAAPPTPSDAWFELAARLQRMTWLVGSASHVLYEWPEPDETRADLDAREDHGDADLPADERARRRARRAGRRNVALWS
ncbi:MAG TPA: hypothetical protein VH025_03895 [Solirubrobacteraceae bacterium]|jgi:hypothetical protein|nr:hypothetical protein [Solirubrobacteraceae bacterium]